MRSLVFIPLLLLMPMQAFAHPAQVVAVEATESRHGWRFDVTVAHAETGSDDYVDRWRIERADGTMIGQRLMAHPHVDEQPFTRSARGIQVPDDVEQVFIRVHTTVEGWADTTTAFEMPR